MSIKPSLGDNMEIGKDIARAMSWAEKVLANALGTEAAMVLVVANEASIVVSGIGPPLPFTYAIPTLALAKAGVGARIGEGGGGPTTLVGASTSLSLSYTILALASVEARAGAGVGEGSEASVTLVCANASLAFTDAILALVLMRVDVETPTVPMVPWVKEIFEFSIEGRSVASPSLVGFAERPKVITGEAAVTVIPTVEKSNATPQLTADETRPNPIQAMAQRLRGLFSGVSYLLCYVACFQLSLHVSLSI